MLSLLLLLLLLLLDLLLQELRLLLLLLLLFFLLVLLLLLCFISAFFCKRVCTREGKYFRKHCGSFCLDLAPGGKKEEGIRWYEYLR